MPEGDRRRRYVAAACGIVIVAGAIGGIQWAVEHYRTGSSWRLTYEGASAAGAQRATTVLYRHNPSRYQHPFRYEQRGLTRLPWKTEVIVNTGQEARLEVTPTGDAIATCRILLDGERVVARGKSPTAGAAAVCKVRTSGTAGKWPRPKG